MDFLSAAQDSIQSENTIKFSDWEDNWEENYVIFIDLIAFASRCILSPSITLNNIVRFHRAINNALQGIDNISKYQFTDACYIITKDPKTALICAVNIQNECLIQNYNQKKIIQHTLFYNMVVPKIVISKGDVLQIKDSHKLELSNIVGLSQKELLAGSGIVKAYYLERKTTGGLISVDASILDDMKAIRTRDSKEKPNSLYKKWIKDKSNIILSHDGVFDIPWLLLQPRQLQKGNLATESPSSFKEKIETFNYIWRTSFTEHLANKTPTETLKQYGGGISHLCEILQYYTNVGPRSWDLTDLNTAIDSL